MAGVDLGKQYGPLPLGAWIVVVGGGLGIAYYANRQSQPPVEVEDQSGVPGVGTGDVGGWTSTDPGTISQGAITTNEQWAIRAINDLIAQGYNSVDADSAIRGYIGGIKLSVKETALLAVALAKWGSPPQPLPPSEGGTGTGTLAAPTGFRVVSTGSTTVTVAWNPVDGASSYRVYMSDGSGPVQGSVSAETTQRQYQFAGLKRNWQHYFSVFSVDSSGQRQGGTATISVRTKR